MSGSARPTGGPNPRDDFIAYLRQVRAGRVPVTRSVVDVADMPADGTEENPIVIEDD
ncbi:hypothetical protein PI125_g8026 [Phytophthora idaei]|nr:hypothetical protein PI125_g8026 [Phytophthora idaei]KAG3127237.1 hypothetical protein PI126_g21950 [Phytophthora idaei]